MCRPRIKLGTKLGTRRAARLLAGALAAVGLGAWLAGCSDSYWDRRNSISLGAGDAIAANTATQTVDPWPAYSGDKNIAFNGQKMQGPVDRYRTGKVIEPADPENFMSTNQQGQTISTTVNAGSGAPAASTTTPSQ